jgi:hypothetical protein
LGSGRIITRAEMRTLLTEDLWDAIRIWKDYRRFGLPNGSGKQGETSELVDLVSAFENEYDDAVAAAQEA